MIQFGLIFQMGWNHQLENRRNLEGKTCTPGPKQSFKYSLRSLHQVRLRVVWPKKRLMSFTQNAAVVVSSIPLMTQKWRNKNLGWMNQTCRFLPLGCMYGIFIYDKCRQTQIYHTWPAFGLIYDTFLCKYASPMDPMGPIHCFSASCIRV